MSQPNVSKHIARLEAELGVSLFHRLGGGIELTEAGRIVREYARQAARISDEMTRALDEYLGLERGVLRLGASSIPGLYLLPEAVAAFQERYPGLEISFEISNSQRTTEGIMAGDFDLGFIGKRSEAAGVQIQPYSVDKLVLIAPPEHPLAKQGSVSRAELMGKPFILREQGSGTRHAMEALFLRMGISPGRTLEMRSCEGVKRAVAAGLGLSLISRRAIELERESGVLVELTGPEPRISRQLYMVTRKEIRPSPAALAFAAFLGK